MSKQKKNLRRRFNFTSISKSLRCNSDSLILKHFCSILHSDIFALLCIITISHCGSIYKRRIIRYFLPFILKNNNNSTYTLEGKQIRWSNLISNIIIMFIIFFFISFFCCFFIPVFFHTSCSYLIYL